MDNTNKEIKIEKKLNKLESERFVLINTQNKNKQTDDKDQSLHFNNNLNPILIPNWDSASKKSANLPFNVNQNSKISDDSKSFSDKKMNKTNYLDVEKNKQKASYLEYNKILKNKFETIKKDEIKNEKVINI